MPTAGEPVTLTKIERIAETTEQASVLEVAINALHRLNQSCRVTVFTDVPFLEQAITQGRAQIWKNQGWKNAKGKPIANGEKWRELEGLLALHEISFATNRDYPYKKWLHQETKKTEETK